MLVKIAGCSCVLEVLGVIKSWILVQSMREQEKGKRLEVLAKFPTGDELQSDDTLDPHSLGGNESCNCGETGPSIFYSDPVLPCSIYMCHTTWKNITLVGI